LLVLAAAAGGVMLLQMLAPPRWRMGPWVQLAGVAGLTLGAPAAVVAARGVLGRPAWWLWAACVLFFAGAVANVHLVIGAPRATPAELARAGRRHLATLAANLALVVVLVQQGRGGHPALLAAAYGPVVVRALAGRRWAVSQPPLKRVGWWETAWALWFVAWTAGWART
jgi:hypothetical protein